MSPQMFMGTLPSWPWKPKLVICLSMVLPRLYISIRLLLGHTHLKDQAFFPFDL